MTILHVTPIMLSTCTFLVFVNITYKKCLWTVKTLNIQKDIKTILLAMKDGWRKELSNVQNAEVYPHYTASLYLLQGLVWHFKQVRITSTYWLVNAKEFYLRLYSTALRTLSLSPS